LLAVCGVGLVVELAYGAGTGAHEETAPYWVGLLSLSYEGNLPTWFASGLLLGCSVALFANARAETEPRQRPFWVALGAVFALMSLDETVEMHERLTGTLGLGGAFHYDWVVFGAGFALLVGLATVPFLRRLPRPTARAFIVAGAVYVTGAALMELPLGWWTSEFGTHNLGYGLIDWVEETLELVGAGLFLTALLRHHPTLPQG